MATIALSPIPPIPSPGDRDFETKIGRVLSHMPTLATELKTIAETVVESAQLVDVEGNATVAATAASQASISANSAMSAGATATTQANNAKAEATKAARSKADAALAASQSGTNAVAALGAAQRAEAAVLAAEAIATTTAETVATQAAADAATQAVSGVIAQAQASADAAALSAADANTAKNAAQTAATTAGQSVAAIATHAQTAQTASTAASNHAHNAGLRAAESLASAQQATSAGQAATAGAAQVLEILDNLTTGPVVSVNGKYGAVNLVKADFVLGNVDNTSDLDKPISTATQAALGGKSDSGHAHGAATTSAAGFMSAADKGKLDGVAENANNYAHPASHPASIITQDAENRFVTDAEKTAWNSKEASGTAAAAMSAHTSAADPHAQYLPKAGGTMSGPIGFAPAQTWPTFNQPTTGNAGTATKLATSRTLTIGSTGKAFDGSSDLTWTLAEIGATGLQYMTEVRNVAAPNATRPVHGVQASGAEANIDLVLGAKGNGAIVAQVPDGTVTGGNKRGTYAIDLQIYRSFSIRVASGDYSFIGGGGNNTASGSAASVGGGSVNTASGSYASIGGGGSNTASGEAATIPGGNYATTNGIQGLLSYGFAGGTLGQNQMSFFGGRAVTVDATPTRITANAGAASASSQLTLRNSSVFRVRGTVVARNTSTNACKEWTFEALIKRGANAAATSIVGTPSITSTFADTEAESWSIAISADTTNGALAITGTGAASTIIRWTAVVHSIEVA